MPKVILESLICIGFVLVSFVASSAAPPPTGWAAPWGDIPFDQARYDDGTLIVDDVHDVSPKQVDLVNQPNEAAFGWYYDRATTRLYFRLVVLGDPVDYTGSGAAKQPKGLASGAWIALLETNCDADPNHCGSPDYAVGVYSRSGTEGIRTWYNIDRTDGWMEGPTDPTHQNDSSAVYSDPRDGYTYFYGGMVRSRKSPSSSYYYLEFFVPLAWLSRPGHSDPAPVTESTRVKIAAVTSQQVNHINKDMAGSGMTRMMALRESGQAPAPRVTLQKSSDKSTAWPGDVITLTTVCTNVGNALAKNVAVVERIPAGMIYVTGSITAPSGATILYQHSENGHWDTNQSLPVVAIKWQLSTLAAGGSVEFSFQVRVP